MSGGLSLQWLLWYLLGGVVRFVGGVVRFVGGSC